MKGARRSTPLSAMRAVVIDTETTGLDVGTARVLQIGAVRFADGRADPRAVLDLLVHPGQPIPPGSTAVHGISDAMVADAPTFAVAFAQLLAFLGDAVLVGQSIGFDVAVLRNEARRAGLRWRPPRVLDTKLLAAALDPHGTEFELDALANRLGLTAGTRHRALDDAQLSAAVLERLLPLLAAAGVHTLADAEARANAQLRIRARQAAAGWYDAAMPAGAEGDASAREAMSLARLDAIPYRHRIEQLMTPARFLPPAATLATTIRTMVEHDTDVLLAGDARLGRADGLVTDRDILSALARDGAAALEQRIEGIMQAPIVPLAREAPLFRALARMQHLGVHHLAVADAAARVVGLLSVRDLIAGPAADALALDERLSTAASPAQLAAACAALPDLARQLRADGAPARTVAAVISVELRELLARAAAQAEQRMARQGDGHAPVPYALLAIGSTGRGECLLRVECAPLLVFASGEAGGSESHWFAAFARHLEEVLEMAGVAGPATCPALTPWARSLAEWEAELRRWRMDPDRGAAAAAFFDGTIVRGDDELVDELHELAWNAVAGSPSLLRALAPPAAPSPPAADDVDLETAGLDPLAAAARTLALAARIAARATTERFDEAARRSGLSAATATELIAMHELMLGVVLDRQLADIAAGRSPGSMCRLDEVPAATRTALHAALGRVQRLRDIVRYALALV